MPQDGRKIGILTKDLASHPLYKFLRIATGILILDPPEASRPEAFCLFPSKRLVVENLPADVFDRIAKWLELSSGKVLQRRLVKLGCRV